MEYRNLGKSGLKVSALSFGSWLTFGKMIEDNTAEACMALAYDNGVNFFDNAEGYIRGKSETVMGTILKKMNWNRETYLVSSKVYFGTGDKPNQTGLSRKHIYEACHAALKRFQLEYLDLFFCHRPDSSTPIEETCWAMHQLIMQGKIFYWGTSEWSSQQIMEAHMICKTHHLIAPTMEQPQYNMFHREKFEKEFHRLYAEVGMGTTIWSPLASGVLTGKYNKEIPNDTRLSAKGNEWLLEKSVDDDKINKVEKLKKVAEKISCSLPQLAIAWCLKNPNVSTVILGASRTSQLTENFESLKVVPKMTEEVMSEIESILKNKPVIPKW